MTRIGSSLGYPTDSRIASCIAPLWETFLRHKRLRKYFNTRAVRADSMKLDGQLSKSEEQERDLVLAYILTSVNSSCKVIIWQMRCPQKAETTVKKTFRTVDEASIDARLAQLQWITFRKRELILEYFGQILGPISKLWNAEPAVSKIEQRRALLQELPRSIWAIRAGGYDFEQTYNDAVARLIVRGTRCTIVGKLPKRPWWHREHPQNCRGSAFFAEDRNILFANAARKGLIVKGEIKKTGKDVLGMKLMDTLQNPVTKEESEMQLMTKKWTWLSSRSLQRLYQW